MSDSQAIESSMQEHRLFPPSPAFAAKAWIKTAAILRYRCTANPSMNLTSSGPASPVNSTGSKNGTRSWNGNSPYAKWFTVGGQTNVAYNCLDRQIELGRGNKTAILWEGEPEANPGKGGQVRRISYPPPPRAMSANSPTA